MNQGVASGAGTAQVDGPVSGGVPLARQVSSDGPGRAQDSIGDFDTRDVIMPWQAAG